MYMKKSLVLFVVCGVLSLSILAPSVCTLLEISVETSMVNEVDDESKKKSEKELEEKQWDAPRNRSSFLALEERINNNYGTFITDGGIGASEVTSPPPEGMTRTQV